MIFTIHKQKQPNRIIRIGYGPKFVAPSDLKKCELCGASFHADRIDPLCMECRAGAELAHVILQPPPVENKQGRKKMADEKKISDETGVKTISKEPADKQGPVGTGAEQPANPPGGENQEDKANG